MLGHIDDLAEDKAVLGDSLESALEQGEKHEAHATKCMEVCYICVYNIHLAREASLPNRTMCRIFLFYIYLSLYIYITGDAIPQFLI